MNVSYDLVRGIPGSNFQTTQQHEMLFFCWISDNIFTYRHYGPRMDHVLCTHAMPSLCQ